MAWALLTYSGLQWGALMGRPCGRLALCSLVLPQFANGSEAPPANCSIPLATPIPSAGPLCSEFQIWGETEVLWGWEGDAALAVPPFPSGAEVADVSWGQMVVSRLNRAVDAACKMVL